MTFYSMKLISYDFGGLDLRKSHQLNNFPFNFLGFVFGQYSTVNSGLNLGGAHWSIWVLVTKPGLTCKASILPTDLSLQPSQRPCINSHVLIRNQLW